LFGAIAKGATQKGSVWRPSQGRHTEGLEAWNSLAGRSFRAILTQKGYFF
jgi:hypothetical protein